MNKEYRHCWFSPTQVQYGTSFYKVSVPGFEGELEVEVTDASNTNTSKECFSECPDMKYVGYGYFAKIGRKNDRSLF